MENSQFHSWFPFRRCINLARRPDRWAKVQAQFDRHGIQVERQEARDAQAIEQPPPDWRSSAGAYACARSHTDAVLGARDAGAPAAFIFEDDVELHPDFPALLARFLAEIPANWDGIWLGALHRLEPLPVSENTVKLVESDSTFAYGLRATVYEEFLKLNGLLRQPVDLTTRQLQTSYNFYCPVPPLAWVTPDYSDIQLSNVNYWWLREGLTVDGAKSQAMIQEAAAVLLPSSRGCVSEDVAHFTIRRYCRLFPQVIVAGYKPDSCNWPANCRFEPIPSDSPDRFTLMHGALHSLGEHCHYVLIAEVDLYMRPWDLKASLLKCIDHDFVCPSEGPLELTPSATRMTIDGQHHTINTSPSSRAILSGDPCFFFTRRTALAGLKKFPRDVTRIFHCPVQAWRLSSDA